MFLFGFTAKRTFTILVYKKDKKNIKKNIKQLLLTV